MLYTKQKSLRNTHWHSKAIVYLVIFCADCVCYGHHWGFIHLSKTWNHGYKQAHKQDDDYMPPREAVTGHSLYNQPARQACYIKYND